MEMYAVLIVLIKRQGARACVCVCVCVCVYTLASARLRTVCV